MLHEQLFPAANRVTGYIIPEVTLDRLSRYVRHRFLSLRNVNNNFKSSQSTTLLLVEFILLDINNSAFRYRYERYERALVKGHKQSLDRKNNKENLDVDMHKYKNQVIQSMQEGNKLRFVMKIVYRTDQLFKYL